VFLFASRYTYTHQASVALIFTCKIPAKCVVVKYVVTLSLVVSLDSVDEGATKNRWSLADRADRESQEAPDSATTPP
jgi:hypothetical protein